MTSSSCGILILMPSDIFRWCSAFRCSLFRCSGVVPSSRGCSVFRHSVFPCSWFYSMPLKTTHPPLLNSRGQFTFLKKTKSSHSIAASLCPHQTKIWISEKLIVFGKLWTVLLISKPLASKLYTHAIQRYYTYQSEFNWYISLNTEYRSSHFVNFMCNWTFVGPLSLKS